MRKPSTRLFRGSVKTRRRLQRWRRVMKIRPHVSVTLRPRSRRRQLMSKAGPVFGAGVVGALLAYLFDPDRGRARRARLRDRTMGALRRTGRRTARLGRYGAAEAQGMRQRMTQMRDEDPVLDDTTLAHKVESEVLGGSWIDKGRINVNAEEGVVVLRGEVARPELIRTLEERVRQVPGVVDVRNLLHLPTTPAPNTRDSVEAGR